MLTKNEIINYKSYIENLTDKLVWCAIKTNLPIYLDKITDEKINEDIKRSISAGFDTLYYYIDNEIELLTKGFGMKKYIKEYYDKYKKEFPDIDIQNVLDNFKLTDDIVKTIQNLDCVKNFINRFTSNHFSTEFISCENYKDNNYIKIKVYLFDEKK